MQDDGGTANSGADLDPSANTITVNVSAVNAPPSGADKTITTLEDTAYAFTTADFGFSDPDGCRDRLGGNALLAVKISTLPAGGVLMDNGGGGDGWPVRVGCRHRGGRADLHPALDANGAGIAAFTFQVQDDGGTANGGIDLDQTANTATFDVTSVNDAPSGTDSHVTTLEDTAYTFTASDFGFSDPADAGSSSGADHLAAVKIATLPTGGTLFDNGVAVTLHQPAVSIADINAGLLTFVPDANTNGATATSFTFRVQDDGGTANGGVDFDLVSNTVFIGITSVNDAPSGTDKTVTTLEDTAYVFTTSDFGFSDPIDTASVAGTDALLAVKISTLPGSGTLTDDGVAVDGRPVRVGCRHRGGQADFRTGGERQWPGYANFTFQVQDDGGTLNGGIDLDPTANTITVDVTSVNDAPSGADKTVTTLEDTAYVFTTADFGFSDPADAASLAGTDALLAVKISTLPANGALTDNGGGG